MFALMNELGLVEKYTSSKCFEWGGAALSDASRFTPEERRRFRVFDVIDLEGDRPPFGVPDGYDLDVAAGAGLVTRTQRWKATPLDTVREQKVEAVKAQAAAILRETDWEMLRALERFVKANLPAEDKALADSREAVRAASDDAEAEVLLAKDAAEIAALPPVDLRAKALEVEALANK
jgi:hypothetical protein